MAITKATASSVAPAAKGDLVVGSGTNDAAVLAVGTNGHILTADSAQSTGLKWAAPGTPALVGVSLAQNGNVSFTANTFKFIDFTTENWDTNTFHDNSSNQSRITIPTGYGGKYLFSGFIGIGGAGSNSFGIYLRKNGANDAVPGGLVVLQPNNAGNTSADGFSVVLNLVATDYIELGLRLTSTTTYSVQSNFQATFLGA